MAEESLARPFYTVLVLAFVCSALVAGATVGLRPYQEANRQLDRKRTILRAAGLYEGESTINTQFQNIRARVVDLASGEFVPEDRLNPAQFDQKKAALDAQMGKELLDDEDVAGLSRVERYSRVYLVEKDQRIDQVILPIRGKGAWSTMYAYVALDGDFNTIRGINFYEHGETPGLGGEIENNRWLEGWQGKQVYGPDQTVALRVVKGQAAENEPQAAYQIDGLSGATVTGAGVSDMLRFWFGDHGFKPFLTTMRRQDGHDG
jgi:Na+-transporting NADH:ubiquinone oxidoreductase subunit C